MFGQKLCSFLYFWQKFMQIAVTNSSTLTGSSLVQSSKWSYRRSKATSRGPGEECVGKPTLEKKLYHARELDLPIQTSTVSALGDKKLIFNVNLSGHVNLSGPTDRPHRSGESWVIFGIFGQKLCSFLLFLAKNG